MSLCLIAVTLSFGSACISQKPEKPPISFGQKHLVCKDALPVEEAINRLATKLENDLFGQPLATKTVVSSFKAHWSTEKTRKALVLFFHGQSGTGKSHTVNLIASSLFRADTHSPSFIHILGSAFENDDVARQKRVLVNRVLAAVQNCPRSVIVIDDADHLGEGVLDALLPMTEFHEKVNSVDYRKSSFVIISSAAGKEVNDIFLENQAVPRHELHLKDFEKRLTSAAFNTPGGLYKSQLIARGVVDSFVPFFPLSRVHVEQCIREHLKQSGRHFDEGIVSDVVSTLQFFHNDFSSSGCKKVVSRTDTRLLEEHDDL